MRESPTRPTVYRRCPVENPSAAVVRDRPTTRVAGALVTASSGQIDATTIDQNHELATWSLDGELAHPLSRETAGSMSGSDCEMRAQHFSTSGGSLGRLG